MKILNLIAVITLSMQIIACIPEVETSTEIISPEAPPPSHTIVDRYTKLDQFGNVLVDQSISWNDVGSEATFDKWSCVLDNWTGFMWEVKSTDGSLRDSEWTYTWYQTWGNETSTGTDSGVQNGGTCFSGATCDSSGYVADVNAVGMCGATNWKIPNNDESASFFANCDNVVDPDTGWIDPSHLGSFCIDDAPTGEKHNTDYFPNLNSRYNAGGVIYLDNSHFWTTEQHSIEYAGKRKARTLSLHFGSISAQDKDEAHLVRLVRNN